MNSLTIKSSSPLFMRFAWKEYRMLRGFWLAGLAIALFIQMFGSWHVLSGVTPGPVYYAMIAWGAAAFYVVGAAITIFCAETEDRTRDYLRLLPGDWRSIFGTKILVALASALLLGCVLSLSGWWFAGHEWPSAPDARLIARVAGVAILEYLVWGVLFSLWWKQPLLAAVAGIAGASLSAQWAIAATTQAHDCWTTGAYAEAVPGRLAVCLVVFAIDILMGRRWLHAGPKRARPSGEITAVNPASGRESATKAIGPRRKMFIRLLWQTWRESWKTILAAIFLSFGMIAAGLLPAYLRNTHEFLQAVPFFALIVPGLLGAMVFRADQQRDHRLFLATHSAKPRHVWLTRQIVWITPVLLVGLFAHLIVRTTIQSILRDELTHYLQGGTGHRLANLFLGEFNYHTPESNVAAGLKQLESSVHLGVATGWSAILAAYGIGQLSSMLLKQSLLSGVLAILSSIVIGTWSVLMFAWGMNPLAFVLPIGLVTLWATWIQMPSWILGKNGWRSWLLPTLGVVAAIILLVAMVPPIRKLQIELAGGPQYPFLIEPLTASVSAFHELEKIDERTVRDLEGLEVYSPPSMDDVTVDGKHVDDFELSERAFELYRSDQKDLLTPNDLAIVDRFKFAQQESFYEQNKAAIPAAIAVLNLPGTAFLPRDWYYRTRIEDLIQNLRMLLRDDALRLTAQGKLDEALIRLTAIIPLTPNADYDVLNQAVLDWANHPQQTSQLLKQSIDDFQLRSAALPPLRMRFVADRERTRKILLGEEVLRYGGDEIPLVLNEFPGERSRALVALDRMTTQALNYVDALTALAADDSRVYGLGSNDNTRQLLRDAPSSAVDANSEIAFRGDPRAVTWANEVRAVCMTSFLAGEQFGRNYFDNLMYGWINAETYRRATLVQLALIAYRLDHDKYPQTLSELTPEYLPQPIADPYSGQNFQYHSAGLDKPLRESQKNIPPGTPFLWSVGLNNAQLELLENGNLPLGPDDLRPESIDQYYYYLRGTEPGPSSQLVFPLPRVDARK